MSSNCLIDVQQEIEKELEKEREGETRKKRKSLF